jgi:hypothetical protein
MSKKKAATTVPLVSAASAAAEFIGISPYAQRIREDVVYAARRQDLGVLIIGESGTGKEVIANSIHSGSRRQGGPFVSYNCADLQSSFFPSILFGHTKGSYTGAISDHNGLVMEADGGTLFLDEVHHLPPDSKPMLLRFLQDHKFRRLGDNQILKADVRIIAATNQPEQLSPDLRQRFDQVPIRTEPLNGRLEDIICLTNHFLAKKGADLAQAKEGKAKMPVAARRRRSDAWWDPRVKFLLYCYDFPGNVRELKNLVGQADDFPRVARVIGEKTKRGMAGFSAFEKGYRELSYTSQRMKPGRSGEPFISPESSIFYLASYLRQYPTGPHNYRLLVRAFEELVLMAYPEMSVRRLSKLLHVYNPANTPEKFRKRYGFSLNPAELSERQGQPPGLYRFFWLWRKARKEHPPRALAPPTK